MKKINNNNLDVYIFIKEYIEENGFSPSYRDILDNTNYKSSASIRDAIYKLAELKLLKIKYDNKGNIITRSIRIIDDDNAKKVIEELRLKNL